MEHAIIENGKPVLLNSKDWNVINDVRHPPTIFTNWSAQELSDIGIFAVIRDEIPEGKIPTASKLEIVDGEIHKTFTLKNVPTKSIAERKEQAFETLADKRWQEETKGIVFNGMHIRTDQLGQDKITGAITYLTNDEAQSTVKWKVGSGQFVEVDLNSLKAIGIAIGQHVQLCFANEEDVSALITAASTHAAMDAAVQAIETGWPE